MALLALSGHTHHAKVAPAPKTLWLDTESDTSLDLVRGVVRFMTIGLAWKRRVERQRQAQRARANQVLRRRIMRHRTRMYDDDVAIYGLHFWIDGNAIRHLVMKLCPNLSQAEAATLTEIAQGRQFFPSLEADPETFKGKMIQAIRFLETQLGRLTSFKQAGRRPKPVTKGLNAMEQCMQRRLEYWRILVKNTYNFCHQVIFRKPHDTRLNHDIILKFALRDILVPRSPKETFITSWAHRVKLPAEYAFPPQTK